MRRALVAEWVRLRMARARRGREGLALWRNGAGVVPRIMAGDRVAKMEVGRWRGRSPRQR